VRLTRPHTEILTLPSGVYAWYFREMPPTVPAARCHTHDGRTLLYIGIAPRQPSKTGKRPSTRTLRHRIRNHMRGNAYGSTLRLTLGCLLADKLSIKLQCVGSGKRLTFGAGEAVLSDWMGQNAFVCWVTTPQPWQLEAEMIASLDLPLNLGQNKRHSFCETLSALRGAARRAARGIGSAQ